VAEDQTKNTGSDRGSQTSPANPYRDEEYRYSEVPGTFHARPERVREEPSERDIQGNPVRYFEDGSTVKPVNRAMTEAVFGYENLHGEVDERTEGRGDHVDVEPTGFEAIEPEDVDVPEVDEPVEDPLDGEQDDERQVVEDDEEHVGVEPVEQDDASGFVVEDDEDEV
jgi:hypothetical protein